MKAHLSLRRSSALIVVLSAAVATAACTAKQERIRAAQKVPANGAKASTTPGQLPLAEIKQADWDKVAGENIRPACDARVSPPRTDTAALLAAKETIATWMDFKRTRPKSAQHGIKTSGDQDPTLRVDSFLMTCGAAKNSVEVNGTEYPFDIAWVVSGQGASITDGVEDAGRYAMVQALSLKEKRMVVVKLFYPSDANRETDDTVVVANLDTLVPGGSIEPLVHNVGQADKPQLETLVFDKGAKEGFYYVAPKQSDRTRARYLGVGRFKVGE